ncbi:MAG: hypothetical protein Q9178_002487 [Gyalolechia marmorata]
MAAQVVPNESLLQVVNIRSLGDNAVMSALAHHQGQPQTLDKPKLNDDFNKMNPADQREAMMKFKHEQANLYYTAATGVENERHMLALQLPYVGMRQYLTKQASMP